MSLATLSTLSFMRPWWLLALLPLAVMLWRLCRARAAEKTSRCASRWVSIRRRQAVSPRSGARPHTNSVVLPPGWGRRCALSWTSSAKRGHNTSE